MRQASFDFAETKPIGLIGGPNLLCLLAEHADTQANTMPPDDWKDLRPTRPNRTREHNSYRFTSYRFTAAHPRTLMTLRVAS
jgi:hypothetical protein